MKLVLVIHHHGKRFSGGHYTTTVSSGSAVYHLNDSSVTKLDQQEHYPSPSPAGEAGGVGSRDSTPNLLVYMDASVISYGASGDDSGPAGGGDSGAQPPEASRKMK